MTSDQIMETLEWLAPFVTATLLTVIGIIISIVTLHVNKKIASNTAMMSKAQVELQKAQLSASLLKERLKIYHGFSNIFRSVLGASNTSDEVLYAFWAETEGVEFFLGSTLVAYRREVQDAFLRLQLAKKLQESDSARHNEQERLSLLDEEERFKELLITLQKQQYQQFQPFFDFSSFNQQSSI